MGITNRAKDDSEQKYIFYGNYGVIGTTPTASTEVVIGSIPFPSTIRKVVASASGVSGAPTLDMYIQRFTTTGITLAGGATTLVLQNRGTSGIQSFVLAASGNTLLNLQSGDVVTAVFAGADTAVDALSVAIVVEAVQDIKTSFGV